MKISYVITFLFWLGVSQNITAQEALAKIEFAAAETEYQSGNYAESLAHLETVKELLGSTNSTVMYLEILGKNQFLKELISKDEQAANSPANEEAVKRRVNSNLQAFVQVINSARTSTNKVDGESDKPIKDQLIAIIDKKPNEASLILETIKAIDELSTTYIDNFKTSVPIEKLQEVYSINKKYKEYAVGIPDLLTALNYINKNDPETAKPLFKKSCDLGNTISCELYGKAKRFKEMEGLRNEILTSIQNEMILVEGGDFETGAIKGFQFQRMKLSKSYPNGVKIKDFYLGTYEVSAAQWYILMNDYKFSDSKIAEGKIPINAISRDQVLVFIAKLNELTGLKYRLPTEAEWEYAARGGINSKETGFAGSSKIKKVAQSKNNAGSLKERGLLEPNELGLYDMSGNVMEWCEDHFTEQFVENSTNSSKGSEFAVRGGSYASRKMYCIVYFRFGLPSSSAPSDVGFRLAMDAK